MGAKAKDSGTNKEKRGEELEMRGGENRKGGKVLKKERYRAKYTVMEMGGEKKRGGKMRKHKERRGDEQDKEEKKKSEREI